MSAPNDSILQVADVDTHLRVGGAGDPLLFLHGFASSDLWLPFHEELSQSFTVYAPDHPGFGQSSMPDWLDKMEDMVIHYAMLLDTLKLSSVHLVGFSLGGWIAAEFASFYPERVKSLTLINAAGLRVKGAPIVDLFAHSAEQLAAICFNDLRNAMVLVGDMSDPLKLFLKDYRERTMLARLAWNPGYSPKLARRLQRVKSPALIIWGEQDRLIPSAHGEAYRAAIPDARLEVIKGCGHMPVIECAPETARLIRDFINEGRQR